MLSMWSFFYPILHRKKDSRKDDYFKEIQLQALAGTELVTWSSNTSSIGRSSYTSDDTQLQEDKPDTPPDRSTQTETAFFVRYIHQILENEKKECLAVYQQYDRVSQLCQDGVAICIILSKLGADYLDERAVNYPKSSDTPVPKQQVLENAALLLNTLRSLGCRVDAITPVDVAAGKTEAIHKLLSELLQFSSSQALSISSTPQLQHLLQADETAEQLADLGPCALLLRWANWHLAGSCPVDSEQPVHVAEPATDLADGRVLLKLLDRLAPGCLDLQALSAVDPVERLAACLQQCRSLGCKLPLQPEDLMAGSGLLGFALLADVFAVRHGLPSIAREGSADARKLSRSRSLEPPSSTTDELEEPCCSGRVTEAGPSWPRPVRRLVSGSARYASTDVVAGDDEELTREERTLRLWLNSLGCSTPFPTLFSEPVRHGWVILEAVEVLRPGSVDWSLVHSPSAIAGAKPIVRWIWAVENCQYAVELCMRRLSASLVGISGADIARGRRTAILALVWQLMHFHTLQVLQSLLGPAPRRSKGHARTSDEVDGWTLTEQPKDTAQEREPWLDGGNSASTTADAGPTQDSSCAGTPTRGVSASEEGARGGTPGPSDGSPCAPTHARVSERDLLRWANWRLNTAGSSSQLDSFRDPCISRGLVLLELLAAIQPSAVDQTYISPGDTLEERSSNARYVISVARKLGCGIFLVWEDLVEVRPRMVLILLAALCALDRERRACGAGADRSEVAGDTPQQKPRDNSGGKPPSRPGLAFAVAGKWAGAVAVRRMELAGDGGKSLVSTAKVEPAAADAEAASDDVDGLQRLGSGAGDSTAVDAAPSRHGVMRGWVTVAVEAPKQVAPA